MDEKEILAELEHRGVAADAQGKAVPDGGIVRPVKKRKNIVYRTARELVTADLPPMEYIVDVIIAKGLVVLTAKSKIGKSWLALQLAVAVANGSDFLGFNTTQGDVLYIDLENTEALTQSRLTTLLNGSEPPDNLVIVNEYSTMRDSFLTDITEYLETHGKVSLVIIDVFQKIKKPKRANESDYEDIYENFTPLKELADKYNISLMLVMHNRKTEDPTDPFSNALGSSAIMGASDQMLVIQKKKRKDIDATLSITGRTVRSGEYAIRFNEPLCKWEMLGDAKEIAERKAREDYNKVPIIRAIKKLVDMNGGSYSGTITEIIKASEYLKGYRIYQSPTKCGMDLKKYSDRLNQYDAILHTYPKNGNASAVHSFRKGSV